MSSEINTSNFDSNNEQLAQLKRQRKSAKYGALVTGVVFPGVTIFKIVENYVNEGLHSTPYAAISGLTISSLMAINFSKRYTELNNQIINEV